VTDLARLEPRRFLLYGLEAYLKSMTFDMAFSARLGPSPHRFGAVFVQDKPGQSALLV
jgi:hypothetical protein